MVPAAWKPKQDFVAAKNFLTEYRLPGDTVACTGTVELVLKRYMGIDCVEIDSVVELEALEQGQHRIVFIYSLTAHWMTLHPQVAAKLHEEYDLVHTVEGSLRGGDITFMQNRQQISVRQ